MAEFIEYRGQWRAVLPVVGGSIVGPLMATWLFTTERIGTAGFVVLVALGVVGFMSLQQWIGYHTRRVKVVAPGKAKVSAADARLAKGETTEFREDPRTRFGLILMSLAMLWPLGLVAFSAYRSGGLGFATLPVLVAISAVLAVVWASVVRLMLHPWGVEVVYPYRGPWGFRSFGYAEIETVAIETVREGRTLSIRLGDGTVVRYTSNDREKIDRLNAALERGVALAKPSAVDLAELP